MNYGSDHKRSGNDTDLGASSGRECHTSYSTAARKWPQEARKIADEMERRKTVVQERMSQPERSAMGRNRGWIVAAVVIGAIGLVGWGVKVAGDLFAGSPEKDPRFKAIQERSQDVEILAKSAPMPVPPVQPKARVVAEKPAPAPVQEQKAVVERKSDTIWLPAPNLPDSVALKRLRVRIVLDPLHKDAPITYVSKDSVWLLMRVNADSAKAYRSMRAYIDVAGNLVIR